MLILGIAGGTGCGKTTIVNHILKQFPKNDISVLYQDSYYKSTPNLSPEERNAINFDHPDAIDFELLTQHVLQLKNGQAVKQPVYSFINHDRSNDTVMTSPKKIIIIEGILILAYTKLRELLDIKVFVDTDSDERLIRRLKRDIAERGRSLDNILNRYQTTLKPMHKQFIEPTKAYADIIIPNNTKNSVALSILTTIIMQKLK